MCSTLRSALAAQGGGEGGEGEGEEEGHDLIWTVDIRDDLPFLRGDLRPRKALPHRPRKLRQFAMPKHRDRLCKGTSTEPPQSPPRRSASDASAQAPGGPTVEELQAAIASLAATLQMKLNFQQLREDEATNDLMRIRELERNKYLALLQKLEEFQELLGLQRVRMAELEEEQRRLRSELAEKEHQGRTDSAYLLETHNTQLVHWRAEREDLMRAHAEERLRTEQEKRQLGERIAALEKQLADAVASGELLRREKTALQDQLLTLQAKQNMSSPERLRLEEQLRELQAALARVEGERDDLKRMMAAKMTPASKLHTYVLRHLYRVNRARFLEADRKLRDSGVDFKKHLRDADRERQRAQHTIAELKRKLLDANRRLEDARALMAVSNDDMDKQSEGFRNLQRLLELKDRQLARLEEEFARFREEQERLARENFIEPHILRFAQHLRDGFRGDYLGYRDNAVVLDVLYRNGCDDVRFADIVHLFSSGLLSQRKHAPVVVSNKAIYMLKPGRLTVERRVRVVDLKSVSLSRTSSEILVLNHKAEADLLIATPKRAELLFHVLGLFEEATKQRLPYFFGERMYERSDKMTHREVTVEMSPRHGARIQVGAPVLVNPPVKPARRA
jgi:predicted  nucleic acid-binding Zn-ribbon protein